jgi:epoxyqueuosine reductase
MDNSNDRSDFPLGTIPKGFVYRNQSKRYPWWVKSVDRMTTEIDESKLNRKVTDQIQMGLFADPEAAGKKAKESVKKIVARIEKDASGNELKDLALHYASTTFFAAGVSMFEGNFITHMFPIMKAVSKVIHPPDELGVPKWQGSPEEASEMVETAARQLGAAQVGFTYLEPRFLEHNVHIDSSVEKIKTTDDGRVLVPEHLKYVIVTAGQAPLEAMKHAPSQIGDMADRSGYEDRQMVWFRVMNFIRGLGYKAIPIPGVMPAAIPFGLMAGMGEIGRMNRLISPYYGGALRIEGILTDMPLALDKPIDFGLQEYCRHCQKCAKVCPANAISFDKDPGWEPQSQFSLAGKKLWYENPEKCWEWSGRNSYYCSACMFACTWTKDDQTFLHTLARISAAKLPYFGKLLAWLDDLFGYGPVPKKQIGDWWQKKQRSRGAATRRR